METSLVQEQYQTAESLFKGKSYEAQIVGHADVIDLLRAAHTMIGQAEQQIAVRDQRIAELEGLLTTDELTNLSNRRGFFEALEREVDRTNRGNGEGGLLIMIDLDHFKAINDTYGHLAGDAVLREVGFFLQKEIRHMDVAARLGGDEFVLLFPQANSQKARRRAEDMAMRFNTLSILWDGIEIYIKGSFGLKDYGPGEKIENILEAADRSLYENKRLRQRKEVGTAH
ncbi:MAG: GGDEF domain-containing protein [Alphaproteobacteria bacterium]|nr:GGDEF domain-containing protein [Alphaproteobacteria bacterium]